MENNKAKATFKELKGRARKSTKGNYLKCVAVPFLVQVITITLFVVGCFTLIYFLKDSMKGNLSILDYKSMESDISSGIKIFFLYIALCIVGLFILAPLIVGQKIYFLKNFRLGGVKIKELFSNFSFKRNSYLKSVGVCFLKAFYSYLWMLLFLIIIGIIGGIFVFTSLMTVKSVGVGTSLLVGALYILAICGIYIFLSRYALVFYLLEDEKNYKVSNIFSKSIRLMKGNKIRFFLLSLSFIGWVILPAIPVGIIEFISISNTSSTSDTIDIMLVISFILYSLGILFIIPYLESTFVAFYEDIRSIDEQIKLEKKINKTNQNIIIENKKED